MASFPEISLIKAVNGICFKYLHNILQWPQINLLLDLNQSHSGIQLNHHRFACCIKCNQQGEWEIAFPLTKSAYYIGTDDVFSSLAKNALIRFQLLQTAEKTVTRFFVCLVVVFFLRIHSPNTYSTHFAAIYWKVALRWSDSVCNCNIPNNYDIYQQMLSRQVWCIHGVIVRYSGALYHIQPKMCTQKHICEAHL